MSTYTLKDRHRTGRVSIRASADPHRKDFVGRVSDGTQATVGSEQGDYMHVQIVDRSISGWVHKDSLSRQDSGAMCGCGKPTYNGQWNELCSRACSGPRLTGKDSGAMCGCGKPTYNGQWNELCSRACSGPRLTGKDSGAMCGCGKPTYNGQWNELCSRACSGPRLTGKDSGAMCGCGKPTYNGQWNELCSRACSGPRLTGKEGGPKCPDCDKCMQWSDSSREEYAHGWRCNNIDRCGSNGKAGYLRWCCAACKNDFCHECYKVPKCPQGHLLWPLGNREDNGWACDGRRSPGGCLSGCTGFHQSLRWNRFRCAECDYDLCGRCFDRRQDPGMGGTKRSFSGDESFRGQSTRLQTLPGASETPLKVAVWNGASDDGTYKSTADSSKAAEHFASGGIAVIICPEGSLARDAFATKGYQVKAGHDSFAAKLLMFYDPKVLTPTAELQEKHIRGGGPKLDKDDQPRFDHTGKPLLFRGGSCFCVWFKQIDTDQDVLVTAVHAGHYDTVRMRNPSCEQGKRVGEAIAAIRKLQEDNGANEADKVIVAGDFNELGLLMQDDMAMWGPLPGSIPNKSCSDVGDTHKNGQFDRIATGGQAVKSSAVTHRNLDKFGSDHNAVSAWGV
eukprot:TRINITY_DN2906_c0_g2_i1.p1 TRINITY_DN2906_c0_g2~~TRINITY_DN2906_c0_g2_i1.p1  ORF type:complete len:619 (-),score=50.74 TRINITY_DN2906_c0_g2_i1:47-1903(-)